MKNNLFLLAALFFLQACGTSSTPASTAHPSPTPSPTVTPPPAGPFDYDNSVSFDLKIASETERAGVILEDINYAAHDPGFSPSTGGRTLAYLVKPKGEGPFAAILYLHWLGSAKSTREQFLDEAVSMAQRGAVCLLIQGYFPWMANPAGDERDRALITGQVAELRRAIDFLLEQPEVDPKRLAFVGQDYGATYGGTLAGIDGRVKTYVLVAGAPSFSGYAGLYIPHETYFPVIHDLDPTQYIAKAPPASIFFQFGAQDGSLGKDIDLEYYNAASEPKKLEWFQDIHDMSSQAVLQARQAWLESQLELAPAANQTAGQIRFDPKGIAQVWVPAGSFQMGTDEASLQSLAAMEPSPPGFVLGEFPSEQPQHTVRLTKGYWIDKYEVTNKAFQAFINDGGYTNRAYWSEAGWEWLSQQSAGRFPKFCPGNLPDNPVACISWYEAEAYAKWRGGRLPTEAEWEYAARGPDSLAYPWGNEFDESRCNLLDSRGLEPAGSYPGGASWVGAHDMAGNVMEWVQDWLGNYPAGEAVDPSGPENGKVKVEKGGWWGSNMFVARSAYRHFEDPPDYGDFHIGFRIVTP
jgi:formylglycine-generating enzyme required for sulfatase activity